jgi:hypothetical protein
MDADLKKILKAVVLEMRHELEGYYDNAGRWHPGDLETRLAEIGVRKDRASIPVDELGRLIDEDVRARKIVDAFIDVREQAGVDRAEAVAEYVRESAYTWANRLVALRCMEARELLDDEVIVGREAYGGRSLVHHRLAQSSPELCAGEDDGRFAMLAQVFAERAKTLPMLFDPESPSIALRPSPAALKNCLAWLSGTQKVRSQEPATDAVFAASDALGWAYQYWNTEEKDRVFETVRTKKGAKIEGADIIPATQLYTEDYMVKFLVQNSLGATWMGMHPESKLFEGWEYYVRDADRAPATKKPLQQVTLLDPACGSGHFLIEAFDMFYLMYEEEGSLRKPEAICKSILENNLFGIDIDERAIQIAEASLWMKAEEKSFGFSGANTNLVAATSSHLKGESWDRFMTTFEKESHIPRVLREFATSIEHIDELGSLARPFEALREIIKAEHEIWEEQEVERVEGGKFLFRELLDDVLATQLPFQDISDKEFFDRTMRHALYAIDGFTKDARDSGEFNDQLMGAEAKTGFRLLDFLGREYQVVVANPPYMGSKDMGTLLKAFLTDNYGSAKSDLFSAFLARCQSLVAPTGFSALVTMQSFLYSSRFSEFRLDLLSKFHLVLGLNLGGYAFEEMGDHVFAICTVWQPKDLARTNVMTILDVQKATNKRVAASECIRGQGWSVYKLDEERLKAIEGTPFLYDLPNEFFDLFESQGTVEELHEVFIREGIHSKPDERFRRFFWEIELSNLRWSRLAVGGACRKWAGLDDEMVDTELNCIRLRQMPTPIIPSFEFYGRCGASYSDAGASGFIFTCREMEYGTVFSSTGPGIIPASEFPIETFMAYLNSTYASFLLNALNPGTHFKINDIKRLPLSATVLTQDILASLARNCIELKKKLLSFDPTSWRFTAVDQSIGESSLDANVKSQLSMQFEITQSECEIDHVVEKLLGLSKEAIEYVRTHYRPSFDRELIDNNLDRYTLDEQVNLVPRNVRFATDERKTYAEYPCQIISLDLSCSAEAATKILYSSLTNNRLADLKCTLTLNLLTELVMRISSHRWPLMHHAESTVPASKDAIVPITPGSSQSTIVDQLLGKYKKQLDAWSVSSVIGKQIDHWLQHDFFREHIKQFNKRPPVWQIQSSAFTSRKSPTFACLVSCQNVDIDTVAKLRTQYTSPLKARFETELRGIAAVAAAERSDRQAQRVVELEESVAELQYFDEKLAAIAKSGFGPFNLLPILRQYAFDDAILSMKACWLQRLSVVLSQLPGQDNTNGVRKPSPLGDWQDQAIKTELHHDLAAWIDEALSHLSFFCSQVGPKAPDAKRIHDDPSNAEFGSLIQAEIGSMQIDSMMLACGVWWGKFDAAVLAPIRERLKTLKAEQKELNAAIKEDRQPVLVTEKVPEESAEDGDSEATRVANDMPLFGNDQAFEQTIELTKAAMKARLNEVKAKIKKFTEEMDSKAGKAQAIRDAIQAWRLPDPIPALLDFSPSSPNLPPLFDQVSSLDERRAPPKTIAEFIAQESLYAPDINDGVRVNIAPLQKAGILAADVLATKDVDKAIADRAEWRADERRWVREGKLPQPGWWKAGMDEGGGMKDEETDGSSAPTDGVAGKQFVSDGKDDK